MANLGSLTATLGVNTSGLAKAERTFRGVMGRMKSEVFSLKTALVALGGAFVLHELKKGIADVTHMAGRYIELGIAMKVAGDNAGYSQTEMLQFQASVEKAGIASIEARQTLLRMAVAGIDLSKSMKLARAAQDLAVVGAINSSEAFERLIYGIQTGQVRILRTIGLNLTFEEGYKRLAKEMGKTTEELTEQEKMQSRVNAVLDQAVKYQGLYEQAMTSAEKQFRSLQRYIDNFKVALGKAFQPAYLKAVTVATELFKKFQEIVSDKTFQTRVEQIVGRVVDTLTMLVEETVGKISEMNKLGESGGFDKFLRKVTEGVDTFVMGLEGLAYAAAATSDALRGLLMIGISLVSVSQLWEAARKRMLALFTADKEAAKQLRMEANLLEISASSLGDKVEEIAMRPLATPKVDEFFNNYKIRMDELHRQWEAQDEEANKQLEIYKGIEKAGSEIGDSYEGLIPAFKELYGENYKTSALQEKQIKGLEYYIDGEKKVVDLTASQYANYVKIADAEKETVDDLKDRLELEQEINKALEHRGRIISSSQLSEKMAGMTEPGIKTVTGGTTLPYTISEAKGGIIPSFANGGFMGGYSSRDKYLAAVRGGEAFIPPERVAQAGRDTVQSIIDGTFRKPTEQIIVNFRTDKGDYPVVMNKSNVLISFLEELRKEELVSGV